jgi:hypothetical protein
MRPKLAYVFTLCVVAFGCYRQGPPASETTTTASAAAAADAAPVKSQEAVMSDAPGRTNASSSPSTGPASQPRQTSFTGVLRGRVMAVGAETTGWRLERDDGTRVDVSVAKVRDAVDGLDGKRVVIHGVLATVNWTERGRRDLLVAERIEPAAEGEQK